MTSLDRSWAQRLDVRRTRVFKPGRAGSDDKRGALYLAALQQFEDLLDAAQAAGYAGRPLPLFYALGQAGRAIVAALGTTPSVRGHGICEKPTADDEGAGLLSRELKRDPNKKGSDAFGAVAAALGSDPFTGCASLGTIWSATPGASRYLLGNWQSDWCPPLVGNLGEKDGDVGMSLYFTDPEPQRPMQIAEVTGSRYPEIPDDALAHDAWGFGAEMHRACLGTVVWDPHGEPPEDALRSRLARTRYDVFPDGLLVPAVNDESPAMHPLMSWWALLFGLSIFARYEPALWVKSLDPDTSEVAVSLHALLDLAPEFVAGLVCEALLQPEVEPLTIGPAVWTKPTEDARARMSRPRPQKRETR